MELAPMLATNDETNGRLAHIVVVGEGLLADSSSCIAAPDGSDLARGELGTAIPDTLSTMALPVPVVLIVGLSTEEQMVGSDTGRIVAMMADENPVRGSARNAVPKRCDEPDATVDRDRPYDRIPRC